jgi:hypothetical protein
MLGSQRRVVGDLPRCRGVRDRSPPGLELGQPPGGRDGFRGTGGRIGQPGDEVGGRERGQREHRQRGRGERAATERGDADGGGAHRGEPDRQDAESRPQAGGAGLGAFESPEARVETGQPSPTIGRCTHHEQVRGAVEELDDPGRHPSPGARGRPRRPSSRHHREQGSDDPGHQQPEGHHDRRHREQHREQRDDCGPGQQGRETRDEPAHHDVLLGVHVGSEPGQQVTPAEAGGGRGPLPDQGVPDPHPQVRGETQRCIVGGEPFEIAQHALADPERAHGHDRDHEGEHGRLQGGRGDQPGRGGGESEGAPECGGAERDGRGQASHAPLHGAREPPQRMGHHGG